MEQADTNLISGLANEFNLDTAWELRAVTAFTKAASAEIRAYIRGHPHKNKQVDLLNELMQGMCTLVDFYAVGRCKRAVVVSTKEVA